MKNRLSPEDSRKLIDALGGNTHVASLFSNEGLTTSAVCLWKSKGMPYGRFLYLSEKFKKVPAVKEIKERLQA